MKKRSLENVLINILYVMAMAMDRIVRVIEILLNSKQHTFHKERKLRFNQIIDSAKNIKRINDLLDEDDYKEALKGREEIYQYYQEDAYKLCRLILLFSDRDAEDEENSNKVFKLLRELKGTEEITEEELKWFYLK